MTTRIAVYSKVPDTRAQVRLKTLQNTNRSLKKVEIVDIPMGVWMAYGIANGVASVAKVVQKNIEEKGN